MKRPTVRHKVEYLAYRISLGAIRVAPERVSLVFGDWVGWIAGVVLRLRRRTVDRHLRWAFPHRDAGWRRRVARASYRHLGRESVATFRLGRMGPEEIRDRTRMVGFEAVREAVAEGKGAIVVTGHFGNWEIGGASLAARGIPMDAIAQRQRNPLVDAEVNQHRRRLDMTIIYRGGAIRKMLRSLRSGRMVGIVGDQNLKKGGVFVDFFGRKASTAPGFAILALRAGAPVFNGCALREPGFPQRYVVTLERVEIATTGDFEEDVLRLTQAHTTWLEGKVRETPEQYLWAHRRWKTQPSNTVPGG